MLLSGAVVVVVVQCLAYLPPFAQFFLSKLSPALPTLPHQQTHFKSQGEPA
jgi:hypothetical protein